MLSSQGFDLWADGYDQSVGLTDKEGGYPFEHVLVLDWEP